jgi:hypothetical protein
MVQVQVYGFQEAGAIAQEKQGFVSLRERKAAETVMGYRVVLQAAGGIRAYATADIHGMAILVRKTV